MDYNEKKFMTLLIVGILGSLFFCWIGDHEKPKVQNKCNCCCTQMENKK